MDSIDITLDEISLLDDVCIGDDSVPQDIDLGFGEVVYVDNGIKDHEKLNNLDYASSGHIGFASSQEVEEIRQQIGEIDLGAIQEQVDANSDEISTLSEQVNGIANDYLNSQDKTELQGNIDANGEQIEALSQRITNVGETASDNTQSINALGERVGKVESDYLTSSDKQEIENSVSSVSSQVEGVATRVGTLETNSATKTEVQAVQTNLDTYKTENNAKVKQNSDAISILNGVEEGSVDYAVKKGINDFAKVVTDNDTVDTFAEVVTFIANHGNEFSALVGEVDKNTNAITTLKGDESVVGSVANSVKNAIDNENLSQYATNSELKSVSDRVGVIERDYALDSDLGELSTKVDGMYTNAQIDSAVSNAITTASNDATSKANTAKTEANSYTDSAVETLNTAIDGKQPKGDYVLNSELGAVAKSNDYNDLDNKPTIPNEYTLPTATRETLGGVKVGWGLHMDENDGTINSSPITYLDVTGGDTIADGMDEGGIYVTTEEIEVEQTGADGQVTYTYPAFYNKLPIVAGKGVSIDINDNSKAEISSKPFQDIDYIDTATTEFVDEQSAGLYCNGTLEAYNIDGEQFGETTNFNFVLPIVSGEGISITKNSNGKAEISASGLATETYVDTKVADLVNSAPETLNTLGELATAIQNHEDEYDALLETVGNKANSSDLATVATSGSYNDLSNKPTIPSKTSQLTNDSGFLTSAPVTSVGGKTGAVSLNASDLSSAGYLNTHPENGATIIPFIHNDLAFLTQKGGTCTIYSTTSTDFTVATLAQTSLAVANPERMFDGTPNYCIITTTGAFTAVVDLVLPKLFSYSNQFYIDFGATAWYAKSISVYAMNSANETSYVLKASTTTNTKGNWFAEFSHTSGSNVSGFNRLRVVIKDFRNTTSSSGKRISQIGLINYASSGVSETYISRGGCEGVYGSLIPQTNNAVDLGSSSNKWKAIYGTTIYQNGKQVANKSEVVTSINGSTGAVTNFVKDDTTRIIIGAQTTGTSYATVVGYQASTEGANSVAIGRSADAGTRGTAVGYATSALGNYNTAIGYQATVESTSSYTMRLGSTSNLSTLQCKVSLSVTSDERDKADIANVYNSLDFVTRLNPVTFVSNERINYISEEDRKGETYRKYGMCEYDREAHAKGTKKGSRRRIGLLAQETQQALKDVYGTDNYANIVNDNFYDLEEKPEDVENKLTLAYANLVPFLIGAIKEQQAQIEELKNKLK